MPKYNTKIIPVFLLTILVFVSWRTEAADYFQLHKADSLFSNKKYTESFDLYSQIIKETGETSPQMLLKMAFIKEGLRDFTDALYYLSLHYFYFPDIETVKKMSELAEKYQLTGYEYSDTNYFLFLYYKYYDELIGGILLISVIYFFISVVPRPSKGSTRSNKFFFVMLLFGLFVVVNYGYSFSYGIIKNDNTYVMEGPSGASDVVKISSKGHRVKLLDKEDIWYKADLNGQKVYIKESDLYTINKNIDSYFSGESFSILKWL
jgi:hypothetical protein